MTEETADSELAVHPHVDLPDWGSARNEIAQELEKDGDPEAFGQNGLEYLLRLQRDYIAEVGTESVRVARRASHSYVDRNDVREADRRVRANPGAERRAWLLGLGGLLAGAGGACLIEGLTRPNSGVNWVWLAVAALLIFIGGVLFYISYPRLDRR